MKRLFDQNEEKKEGMIKYRSFIIVFYHRNIGPGPGPDQCNFLDPNPAGSGSGPGRTRWALNASPLVPLVIRIPRFLGPSTSTHWSSSVFILMVYMSAGFTTYSLELFCLSLEKYLSKSIMIIFFRDYIYSNGNSYCKL